MAITLGAGALLATPDAHAVENGGPAGGTETGTIPLVDGQPANSVRWLVFLNGSLGCTASVFLDRWAITARHCVNQDVEDGGTPPDWMRLSTRYGENDTVDAAIDRVYYPEVGDIALLQLTEPYLHARDRDGRSVRPHGPTLGLGKLDRTSEGVAYGFGQECPGCPLPEFPKAAGMRTNGRSDLNDNFGRAWSTEPADVTVPYPKGSVLYPAGRVQKGDSGGPLVVDGQIIGICTGVGDTSGLDYFISLHERSGWIFEKLNL